MKNLTEVQKRIKERNGVTFQPFFEKDGNLLEPSIGFMISKKRFELQIHKQYVTENTLSDYINRYSELLQNEYNFVGVWIDGDIYYFDICINIEDLRLAVIEGYSQNQLAIWDVKLAEEIRLPVAQKTGTETQKKDYIIYMAESIVLERSQKKQKPTQSQIRKSSILATMLEDLEAKVREQNDNGQQIAHYSLIERDVHGLIKSFEFNTLDTKMSAGKWKKESAK